MFANTSANSMIHRDVSGGQTVAINVTYESPIFQKEKKLNG